MRAEPVRKELGGRRQQQNQTKQKTKNKTNNNKNEKKGRKEKRKEKKEKKKEKKRKKKEKNLHTEERKEPYEALERREQKKEATRRERSHKKREKGENDIKEEQVEKGLKTSPHKSAQKWKEPSKWLLFFLKPKQLKPKFASKTALEKSLPKQNKIKQIARYRNRNRETELELTHLFKNKSFDISLPREFLYTSQRQNWNWRIFSKISRLTFLSIGSFFTHPMLASFLFWEFLSHIPYWFHVYVGSFSYTSRAGLIFIWGVSLTHPVLASFLCGEFLLHILSWPHFSREKLKFVVSPDITSCGWLGSKHQLTN